MKLAKVMYGVIFSHRDGNESEIVYNTNENESIVPMPEWAVELRERNLASQVATEVIVWDYELKQFDRVPVLPNFQAANTALWKHAREIRNKLLSATDWMAAVTDSAFTADQQTQITKYRAELRNFTRTSELNSAEKLNEYFTKFNKLPTPLELLPANPSFIDSTIVPILQSFDPSTLQ